jgi:hypothetical protein
MLWLKEASNKKNAMKRQKKVFIAANVTEAI